VQTKPATSNDKHFAEKVQDIIGADSDEASHRFRRKPATCSDRSQPGIPTEASRGGGVV